MQGKSLAFSTTKSGDFAELNTANLRSTEVCRSIRCRETTK
jgi:hypothetical protein